MSSVRAFLLLLCCVVFSALSKAQTNPGVVVRLSKSALDYTAQRAIGLLSQHLRSGLSIPDVNGSYGGASYSLTGMNVRDFRLPGSTVHVNSGRGVSWYIRNANMSIGGNWWYEYHVWWFIYISGGGSFTISMSDVSTDIQISLGRDSTGRPTVSMLRCSASVGRAPASFSGSYLNWLYNYVYGWYEEQVKGEVARGICKAVRSTIENDGTRVLANLQTHLVIRDGFDLDYSLVHDPVYGHEYIESFHSGQFRYNGQGAPFQPSPMPRYSSSMVAIYVSEYVIQSLGYVMQKHGQLSYTLTKNDLPADSRNNLDMNCTFMCLGTIFPSVASNYSGSSAELITNAVRPPTVKIVGETVKINFEAEMKIAVRGQDGRHIDLVKIVFGGFVHGSAWIENDKIVGRVLNASVANFSLTVLHPEVNQNIPVVMLNSFISDYIKTYTQAQIVPQLNSLGAIGFQLPKLSAISFIGPQLKLRDGFFLVETNVA